MKQQVTLGKRAMKLALCATVAGAALAAQTAYAAVVTVDFTSNPFSTVPYNIDGFYINLVTGATATAGFAGYDINPCLERLVAGLRCRVSAAGGSFAHVFSL